MDSLSHRGRRLAEIHFAGRDQDFAQDAFVNGFVLGRQAGGVQGLTDDTGNAVEVRSHWLGDSFQKQRPHCGRSLVARVLER
jgi:hypothetical protein